MACVDVPQKRDSPRGVVGASMSSSTERADSGGRRKRRSRIVCGLCTALSTRFLILSPRGPTLSPGSRHGGSRATWPTHLSSKCYGRVYCLCTSLAPTPHMGREGAPYGDGFECRALCDQIRISPQIRRRRPRCWSYAVGHRLDSIL